jgi:replicative superfamily II helicase
LFQLLLYNIQNQIFILFFVPRANTLLNNLLEEGKEDQIRMVVIDEIHMLSDQRRGFLLEVFLSKIKFLLKKKVQVVGMSATLPNIKDLAVWLEG